MLKIGLTGSIGTGKSTVSKIFEELGSYVIDMDKLAHQVLKNENIKNRIRGEFGDVFDKDGNIDRKKLAKIVFNDEKKRKILEGIIHPEVRNLTKKIIKDIENREKNAIVIVEVPLLIETGSYKDYDLVIVVYAPRNVQIERLLKKGYSLEDAIKRINSQMDIEEKIKFADIVINNTSDLNTLREEVKKIYLNLLRGIKNENKK